jgi:hypothetical protein
MTEENSIPDAAWPASLQAGAPEIEDSSSPRRKLDPLSMLWRAFAAPQTLIALLGLVAGALALGIVLPQMPPQAAADPQTWLAMQAGLSAQAKSLIYTVGLFDIYHTIGFRLLLALTGLVLFVWCMEAASLAWRATVRRSWVGSDIAAWGRRAPLIRVYSSHSPRSTLAGLQEFLDQKGYRWAAVRGPTRPNLVAVSRGLSFWAEPIVYGALLAVLAGVGIANYWGWQTQDWQLAPGDSHPIGNGTTYTVRLEDFNLERDGDGRLLEYSSVITWLKDGAALEQARLGTGRPASRRGVTVRQVGYVPVVQLRGRDNTGRPLAFQAEAETLSVSSELTATFPTPDAQPLVLVLGHDQFLALTFEPLCAEGKPALGLALFQAGSPEGDAPQDRSVEQQSQAVLYESGSVGLGNLELEVNLDYYPILRAGHRPGVGLVIAGMFVVAAALAAGWLVPPRLLWIAVGTGKEDRTLVQVLLLPMARGSRWSRRLAAQFREVLGDDA